MDHLEILVRETLLERAAEAPDGAALLDAVRERTSVSSRRRRPAAALVAGFVVVAIVGSSGVVLALRRGSGSPPSTTPRLTSSPSVLPTTTTGPAASVCMHAPIREVHNSYNGLAAPNGARIDYDWKHQLPARDQQGNLIRPVGLSFEVVRRDGVVILPGASELAFGDFDGDGRTDLVVDVQDNRGVRTTYIIPGTVAVGTHDPAAVGIRVASSNETAENPTFPWWTTVGDQNHDGADDLMFGSKLYSGKLMMTARPRGLPPPFRTLPQVVGILELDPTGPPTLVEVDFATSELVVDDRRSDRLTFDVPALTTNQVPTSEIDAARATAWLVGTHRIVEYSYNSRSGETAWRWDLNAPCGK